MGRRRCTCCGCVNISVDDDQTSLWNRTDVGGVATVTILRSVPLCGFNLSFSGSQPSRGGPGSYVAFDGTCKIYLLDDPSDADIDAIGVIEYQSENARDPSDDSQLFTLAYFVNQHDDPSTRNPISMGSGAWTVSDWGISETVTYYDTVFAGATLVVHDNIVKYFNRYSSLFALTPTGGGPLYEAGGPTLADIETLSGLATIAKSDCVDADRLIYIRYQTSGDFTLPETKFVLQTANAVGDRSCRTDSESYPISEEFGNCSTPPSHCLAFPTEKGLFLKARIEQAEPSPGYGALDETVWLCHWNVTTSGDNKCHAETETFAIGTFPYDWEFSIDANITCESGVVVLNVEANVSGSTAIWEVELAYSVTEPSDIPTTVPCTRLPVMEIRRRVIVGPTDGC